MLIIGSHVSYTSSKGLVGSVMEALSYGANTFMIYTGAPQNTMRSGIVDSLTKEAHKLMTENKIDINNVIAHAPYIINLANEKNIDFGISFLIQELKRIDLLGIKYLVMHPGSAVNNSREKALDNIIFALNKALDTDTSGIILLESMAGKGNEVGINFEELKYIINGINKKDRIGICLDTCHLNDAGFDLRNFDNILDLCDKEIGLDKVKCLHINDSKNIVKSHKDRHENIGLGHIGFDTLINIIYNKRLSNVPKILETPYVSINDNEKDRTFPPYKFEIEMIKNKENSKDLINKIRNYYNQ